MGNFFFRKSCRLRDNVKKCRRARSVTDDSMSHPVAMLDN